MGGVMEKIKIIDEHPNKIHDGMELFLVTGKQLTNAGAFLKGETFLTGFQKNNNANQKKSEYILDNNKCMSQSEREEFGELYPVYKFTLKKNKNYSFIKSATK